MIIALPRKGTRSGAWHPDGYPYAGGTTPTLRSGQSVHPSNRAKLVENAGGARAGERVEVRRYITIFGHTVIATIGETAVAAMLTADVRHAASMFNTYCRRYGVGLS